MKCMRLSLIAYLATAGLSLASHWKAKADTILDTGPIRSRFAVGFTDPEQEAIQFTIADPIQIRSIEGFLYRREDQILGRPGELVATVYSNGNDDLPSERLFEETFFVPNSRGPGAADWHGAFDLSWNLEPGTYWVAIAADQSFAGGMSFDEDSEGTRVVWFDPDLDEGPEPLQWLGPFFGQRLGFRVIGSIVPEPTGSCLITGIAIGWLLRKKSRQR